MRGWGDLGRKLKTEPWGAWFSRTKRGRANNAIGGTYLGWGKPGFGGWEVGINQRARVGNSRRKQKQSYCGSVFANDKQGGPECDR